MRSVNRLIELQSFLHAFQSIERTVDVPDREAAENDVEHSFHLALAGWFLASDFPELDRNKIIRYSLIHDLVEVHAGDTFFYADASELATKEAREQDALVKIKDSWPDFPELWESIRLYETKEDDEAKFVYALDKIMPMIVIMQAGGKTWKDNNISFERQRSSKLEKVKVSKHILPYFNELIKILEQKPELFAD